MIGTIEFVQVMKCLIGSYQICG